jgi:hypothetical protein
MKLLSLLVLINFPILCFSQTEKAISVPDKKTVMIELNFNPFGNEQVFSFTNLQTKFWLNNSTALRMGFEFDQNKNTITKEDYDITVLNKNTVKENSFLFGIKPGVEFRILESSKISPYWGVELMYKYKKSGADYVDYISEYNPNTGDNYYVKKTTEVKNAWRYQDPNYYYLYSFEKERAFNTFGANLLLGADYFIVKHLYLGFEIGLGYEATKFRKIEITTTDTTIPVKPYPAIKTSSFGFYYNSAIRIGVWF